MRKVLGIFRGFPGLGRVVSGVSILETLRDEYGCIIEAFSYLQGKEYLQLKGFDIKHDVVSMDYCSMGLLPTYITGSYLHKRIRSFQPDIILVDGEPLMIQSLKLSHPDIKIVALLNPADIENQQNDQDTMAFFKSMYSIADLGIIHGLKNIYMTNSDNKFISINTILRKEILNIVNRPSKNIYCTLGGGTVNVDYSFVESTIQIAKLCIEVAGLLKEYRMHIICSSKNIYDALINIKIEDNVILHNQILNAEDYYSNAGLIITRSGRNTLSELAYLGIPSISLLSGCQYRKSEQKQNIDALNLENFRTVEISIEPDVFANIISSMMDRTYKRNVFTPGNMTAIDRILKL